MLAAGRTLRGSVLEIGERPEQIVRTDVGQPERAQPGGIDNPAAFGEGQCDCGARRVSPFANRAYFADPASGVRHQGVDQCRLAYSGVPDEYGDVSSERSPQLAKVAAESGHDER